MTVGGIGQAGRLNRRVKILKRTSTQDNEGNTIDTWPVVATVDASIEALGLAERLQADRLELDITHVVTMRYPAPVTHSSRLQYGDRVFEVRTVNNVGEGNARLEIVCVERQISG